LGKSQAVSNLPPWLFPWLIRASWLVLPVALGPAVGGALAARSAPVQGSVAIMAWGLWTAGVIAVLVPRTLGLTALRTVAPAALGLAGWAALNHDDAVAATVAVAVAAVATVVALSPATGDLFVNGSAYGDERRFALRPPAAVILGPVQLVWLLVAAGALTGPLLLATRQWVPGAAATAIGAVVLVFGTRSLHQLSRRWLVMVPAGLVVHDPTAVTSHLFKRSTIASIGPAPADTGALDLTGGALGLALEIQLVDTQTLELRRRGQPPKLIHATAVMFTPTRPGAVLREAANRRVRVS
jgi:hypothetical protein